MSKRKYRPNARAKSNPGRFEDLDFSDTGFGTRHGNKYQDDRSSSRNLTSANFSEFDDEFDDGEFDFDYDRELGDGDFDYLEDDDNRLQ